MKERPALEGRSWMCAASAPLRLQDFTPLRR
jgi:hypothetical protein